MTNPTKQSHRFKELDALRGLAALMVMFFHFSLGRALPVEFKYIRLGNTGVELFFMISGFVIFMSFDHITKSSQFIKSRLIRLYPTYWTVVTFTFLLIATVSFKTHDPGNINFKTYLGNMTMFQYYLKIPDLDGPYWTMIIEMTFYIVMLLLFRFKQLKHVIVIGIVTCLIMQALFFTASTTLVSELITSLPLLIYAPLFFAGIIFFQIKTGRGNQLYYYIFIGLFFICQVASYKYIVNKIFMSRAEYAVMLTIYFSLFILFVNHKLRFIVSKTTLFFGKISYALYLIHQYLSINFIIPTLMNELHFRFPVAAFIAFLVSTLLAALITNYIEIPVRRLAKKHIYSK